MKAIRINATTPYNVIIGKELLSSAGKYCQEALGAPCRVCLVSDDNVAPLYLHTVRASLERSGFTVIPFVFPHGETSKSIETFTELLEFSAQNHLTRSDCFVALGGGVVGDLTGFAASVYLRGIRFIQIPTTLLAAVDSSVGGKTGVNLGAGKNLVGAFHQPSLVLCDPLTLNTLPSKDFSDGCAEVIKYGIIGDRPFFDLLRLGIRDQLDEVIATCVQHKAELVEADEFDRGARQLLNLGHTVGHAIERCSQFSISHGSAVAIGMVVVTRAAVSLGLCPASDLVTLIEVLQENHLPVQCPYSAKELEDAALSDKKRSGATITFVVPNGIGDSRLYPLPVDAIFDFLSKGLSQ